MESPHIRADIVEASEFPELAERFNVYAVPKTVINETHEFVGALPEVHFVAAITQALGGLSVAPEGTGEGAAVEGEATLLDSGLGEGGL